VHIDEEGDNESVGEMEIEGGADGCHVGLTAKQTQSRVIRRRVLWE